MESKNIIAGVVALTISIILVASVLVPVIVDTQKTAGDEVTLTNSLITTTPAYTVWNGEDVEFIYDSSTHTYTIDGTAYAFYSVAQRIVLASNDFAYRNGGSEDVPQLRSEYIGDTADANVSFTFTITDGAYSLTLGEDTHTGTIDWMVYADPDGTANLGALPANGSFVTGADDDVVVLGNIYTTGSNDTFYAYYGGDLSVNAEYEDSSSVTLGKTLKNGYTDIYDTTVTVNIGDESFTPYFILVPVTVDGHEASGAAYSLYGIIPLLVIVSIVLMAAGMIYSKRD